MTPKRVQVLPLQLLAATAPAAVDAIEQSVRRLADLVLGATALAERLQRLAELAGPTEPSAVQRARTARIAQLRAFAAWGRAAIDRAVADDAYAHQVCGDDVRAAASPPG